MIRDPLYRAILERLGEKLDPDAFEHAVPRVLPSELGCAIPILGGQDAGFDGAIIAGEGEPYPIVCTTGTDVLGNLKKNLASNAVAGFLRRRAVVATSQKLSNQRKRNLFKAARTLGFELMGIFDKEPLAGLLYQKPRVRLELLGIPGDPRALSALPAPGRYPFHAKLLARDDDLAWLHSSSGDRILAGVPGAGKTALLERYVDEGEALFVRHHASIGAVLDAWREFQPRVLLLDDAHVQLDLLDQLRTARQDTGADYEMVATTWPGEAHDVAGHLGVDFRTSGRTLELLTRAEILELYREMDVRGQDMYIRDLVDQASNRPGLAVTLGLLWKQGAWEEILRGQALSAFVSRVVRSLTGEGIEILAALALGGRAGCSLRSVSDALHEPIVKTRGIIVNLSAAGVIAERGDRALAVEPAQLRSALLADVFFNGRADRLDYLDVFSQVERRSDAVEAILTCLARGGSLPQDEARSLLAHGDARSWKIFSRLGRDHALWALENYPGDGVDIVRPVLDFAPEEALALLLANASPPPENLGSTPGHPLRVIRDWVRDFMVQPGPAITADQIRKRAALTDAVLRYAAGSGDSAVIGPAMAAVLDPTLESWSSAPENSNTINMRCALIPVEVIEQLTGLWERLKPSIGTPDRLIWAGLREVLWSLIHPIVPAGVGVSAEQRKAAREFAKRIVLDLLSVVEKRPGLERALADFAVKLELGIVSESDPTYDVLFPKDPVREPDHECWSIAQSEAISRLADDWKNEPPDVVAAKLKRYRFEAEIAGHNWPDNTILLATKLAETVGGDSKVWLDALTAVDLGRGLGAPFLAQILRFRLPGWEKYLAQALESDELVTSAIELCLTAPSLDRSHRSAAIKRAEPYPDWVETCALRGEIPTEVLALLLAEGAPGVAFATAIGHWIADPKGDIEPSISDAWRLVIMGTRSRDVDERRINSSPTYWLGEILANDGDLAYAWLKAEIEAESPLGFLFLHETDPAPRAAQALGSEQRRDLVASPHIGDSGRSLVRLLVGADPEVFRVLLARDSLRGHHLAPLAGVPTVAWWSLAEIALENGFGPTEVAQAAFNLESDGWSGSEAKHWEEWVEGFGTLRDTENPTLKEVSSAGKEIALHRVDRAHQRERQEAMRG